MVMNKAIKDEFIFYPKSSIKAGKAGEGKKTGKYPLLQVQMVKVYILMNIFMMMSFLILGTGGLPSCNYVNGKFSLLTDNLLLKSKGNFKSKCVYYYLRYDNFNILKKGFMVLACNISAKIMCKISICRSARRKWRIDFAYLLVALLLSYFLK